MKVYALIGRRGKFLFEFKDNLFSLPIIVVNKDERIFLKVSEHMRKKFNINVKVIIDNPWCIAFTDTYYKILNFIPDFFSEISEENLILPLITLEEPMNSFWLNLKSTENKIHPESQRALEILRNIILEEKIVEEFCG